MKIKRVVTHVLEVNLPHGEVFAYSQGWYHKRRSLIVEIETEDGIVGYGEAFGPPRSNAAIVNEVYLPILVNRNPLERESLWLEMYNTMRDHGRKGSSLEAISAVDIALWDIAGKYFGVPCYMLTGRKYQLEVKAYATGFYRKKKAEDQHDDLIAEALGYANAGFDSMKIKIGFDFKEDIKLLRKIRSELGSTISLMIDANHAFDESSALRFAREVEELDISWFEEPVVPEDLDGYQRLRLASPITIAAGEAEFSRWGFRDLAQKGCADILQPDCCAVGGLTEALKVADLADAWHLRCIPHVWGTGVAIAAALQFLAMIAPAPPSLNPQRPVLELDRTFNPLREELNLTPPVVKPGMTYQIPSTPGIGFDISQHVLQQFKVE